MGGGGGVGCGVVVVLHNSYSTAFWQNFLRGGREGKGGGGEGGEGRREKGEGRQGKNSFARAHKCQTTNKTYQ